MNCKPGGLAIVIKCTPNNQHLVGRVVTTVRQYGDSSWLCEGNLLCYGNGNPWPGEVNGLRVAFPTSWLHPIGDNDGEDETLTWAGKPMKEPV